MKGDDLRSLNSYRVPLSVVDSDAAGRHVNLRLAGDVGAVEESRVGVDLDDGGGGVAFEGR